VASDEAAAKTGLVGPNESLESPEIPQFYLPGGSGKGAYAPRLYGAARIQFGTRRQRIDEMRRVAFLVPLDQPTRTVDWDTARPTDITPEQLLKEPPARATRAPLPDTATKLRTFAGWAKSFDRWLARTQRLDLPLKPDQSEPASIGPKRGGVSVELVAIVWEPT
jgi:hypothetical protein